MPIYEYEASDPEKACDRCRWPFEFLQGLHESPIHTCPTCGATVRRRISLTHALIPGGGSGKDPVERKVAEYERKGLFSHAAELADKASEKPERAHLKERAMENYKKAGYEI
jgi:putative FmdB family regulatory protein